MAKIIEKSTEVLMQGLDSLKNIKKDKREYKEYVERTKALPEEYRFAFKKMTEYMWSYSGSGDGYDMLAIHKDLLELFEESTADKKTVSEVIGEDAAAFCDELLKNAKTYTETRREKLNRDINKK